MHGFGIEEELARERIGELHGEAEGRRVARAVKSTESSLRARLAKRLFEAAVAMERDATWKVVWEKMEAPRRS